MFPVLALLSILSTAQAAADRPAAGASEERAVRAGELPAAWATWSADGRWTLVLAPPVAWASAEVYVSGSGSTDVGPAAQAEVVRLEGIRGSGGPMWVTVQAAKADGSGVAWTFQVEPTQVPIAGPVAADAPPRRRGLVDWLRRVAR